MCVRVSERQTAFCDDGEGVDGSGGGDVLVNNMPDIYIHMYAFWMSFALIRWKMSNRQRNTKVRSY